MAEREPKTPAPSEEFWLFGYGEDHRGTPESPGRVVTLIEQSYYDQLVDQVHSPLLSLHSDSIAHVSLFEKPNLPALPVYGAAYRIPPEHVAEVSAYLDIREINGYSIQYTDFYPSPSSSRPDPIRKCLVYIGLPTNPQFLGAQDPQHVAGIISVNKGPSGENAEYLFMLEKAHEGLGKEGGDEHIKDLANRVRDLQARGERGMEGKTVADEAVENEMDEITRSEQSSREVQEKTEERSQ